MKWNQSHFYVWPFSNFQSINQPTTESELFVCLFVCCFNSQPPELMLDLFCLLKSIQFSIHSINQSIKFDDDDEFQLIVTTNKSTNNPSHCHSLACFNFHLSTFFSFLNQSINSIHSHEQTNQSINDKWKESINDSVNKIEIKSN